MSEATSPPGITRRLASMLYEALLVTAVLAVAFILPHLLLGTFANIQMHHVVTKIHFFLVLLIYFSWFWVNGGQTLAMKTWRIRLVSRDGLAVRPAQAILRYLLCWPSIILGGVGIVWALFDRDRQFLHDRLSGTQLVMV